MVGLMPPGRCRSRSDWDLVYVMCRPRWSLAFFTLEQAAVTLPGSRVFLVGVGDVSTGVSNMTDPVLAFPTLRLAGDRPVQVFYEGADDCSCAYHRLAIKLRSMAATVSKHGPPGAACWRLPPIASHLDTFVSESLFVGRLASPRQIVTQFKGRPVNRPILVKVLGDPFWGPQYARDRALCDDVDLVFARSKSFANPRCVHLWTSNGMQSSGKFRGRFHLQRLATPLAREAALDEMGRKVGTPCVMVLKTVFRKVYLGDALVRHAFVRLFKEITNRSCAFGGPMVGKYSDYMHHAMPRTLYANYARESVPPWTMTSEVLRPYKFSVAMENQRENGYVTEKIFNAVLANTVPIYFGAPDIHKYVNPSRFIHCNVSAAAVAELRARVNGLRNIHWRRSAQLPPAPELIDLATYVVQEELKPCVRRVVEIDSDDEAYARMLSQPVFSTPLQRAFFKNRLWTSGLLRAMRMFGIDA